MSPLQYLIVFVYTCVCMVCVFWCTCKCKSMDDIQVLLLDCLSEMMSDANMYAATMRYVRFMNRTMKIEASVRSMERGVHVYDNLHHLRRDLE